MKPKIKKALLPALLTIALATIGSNSVFAFGEDAKCKFDPTNGTKFGICLHTTEGTWTCIVVGGESDCSN